jgi:hypothetical protein
MDPVFTGVTIRAGMTGTRVSSRRIRTLRLTAETRSVFFHDEEAAGASGRVTRKQVPLPTALAKSI